MPFDVAKGHHDLLDSLEITVVVFAGAMVFWLVVAHVVRLAKAYIHDANLCLVARLSSCAIQLFGTAILIHCLFDHLHPTT